MIDAHFTAKVNAQFETAFTAKFTPARTSPKTYTPVPPKLPWYLDFDGDGEPDGSNFHN